MFDHPIIKLLVEPSFGEAIEVRIASVNGVDRDEDLTLSARQGFLLDAASWTTTKLTPDDATRLWAILEHFEVGDARSDTLGLDGTTFSLEICCAELEVSLEWWENPPASWLGPRELVDELLRLAGPQAEAYRR